MHLQDTLPIRFAFYRKKVLTMNKIHFYAPKVPDPLNKSMQPSRSVPNLSVFVPPIVVPILPQARNKK